MDITQEEFVNCIVHYQRLVITICLSFTDNYFDAEDLAQETFLAAIKGLEGFDGQNPKAWLVAIAANKCRDFLKSPARRVRSLPEEDAAILTDPFASPHELAEKSEAGVRVLQLCSRLKEPYREVATAYFCEDKKLSELALATGQSLRTLETRLYRAKKVLKTLWEEESVCV